MFIDDVPSLIKRNSYLAYAHGKLTREHSRLLAMLIRIGCQFTKTGRLNSPFF